MCCFDGSCVVEEFRKLVEEYAGSKLLLHEVDFRAGGESGSWLPLAADEETSAT